MKLNFHSLWWVFFLSSVLFFMAGILFFVNGDANFFAYRHVKCSGDAGAIFFWQVISSNFLAFESILINILFYSNKSVREHVYAVDISSGVAFISFLVCAVVLYFCFDAIVNYEFQCSHPRFSWLTRYVVFTVGMNIIHLFLFLIIFCFLILIGRVCHE